VYWTFAVELVTGDGGLPGDAGRLLVVLIGAAGIASGLTGAAVRSFGERATLHASVATLAGALLLIALGPGAWPGVLISGLMFGAAYFAVTACLGIWSLRLFPHRPAAGFAATYFLISVGQLIGPLPAGLLGDAAGLAWAFYAGAAVTLATLMWVQVPSEVSPQEPTAAVT
jgi:predicted MFS family arabinose efflux permease